MSRLTEVAKILSVEVSELFKPSTTDKVVSGYLECDGRIVKVESLDAIKRFIADVEAIENAIDEIQSQLPALNNFVLPGGSSQAAFADLCRTTTRRAERRVVELAEESYISPLVIKYLNRLSDFFFVFARFNNIMRQIPENLWNKEC